MEIPYNIIDKVLEGTASQTEREHVALWRSLSTENDFIYRSVKNEKHFTETDSREFIIPDKEKVWGEINRRITIKKPAVTYSLKQFIAVAAMVAVVFLTAGYALSLFFSNNNTLSNIYTTVSAPEGQKSKVVLPDGTEVWLNSGSSITYSSLFAADNRDIKMSGEVYFDVAENRDVPFNLNIDDEVSLTVLGTSFNVKSEESAIEVALNHGSVQLADRSNNANLAILSPMERAVIEKRNGALYCSVDKIGSYNYNVWLLDELKFENASFDDMIMKLEKRYGMTIDYSNIDSNRRYWMSVKDESLEEMLNLLIKIVPMTYTIENKHVMIEGLE